MRVYVLFLESRPAEDLAYDLPDGATVANLKDQIRQRLNQPDRRLMIIFNGVKLTADTPLVASSLAQVNTGPGNPSAYHVVYALNSIDDDTLGPFPALSGSSDSARSSRSGSLDTNFS